MKLQYLWVEKYRNIENTGFNFSSEFKFSYNKYTKKLIYDNNKDYVDNFFGENIDITAILGINGSGKTTILEFIMRILNCKCVNTNYIIVFYNKETKAFLVYHTGIICNGSEFDIVNLKKDDSGYRFPEEFKREYFAIYYTEVFSEKSNNSFSDNSQSDLSPINMLYKYEDEKSIRSLIIKYRSEIIQNQLEFIANYKEIICDAKINFNKNCVIYFKSYEDMIKKIEKCYEEERNQIFKYRELDIKDDPRIEVYQKHHNKCLELENKYDVKSIFNDFLPITNDIGRQAFVERITHAVFCSLISELKKPYPFLFNGGGEFNLNNVIDIIGKVMSEAKLSTEIVTKIDRMIKFVEYLKDENLQTLSVPDNDWGIWSFVSFDNYIAFLKYLKIFAERYDGLNNWDIHKPIILPINSESEISALKFHSFYSKINRYLDFLDFSYGLSSGEMAFLNLFSKANKLLKLIKCHNNVNGVTLIIDEADMLLHPEWQRIYINSLVNFLKKVYGEIYIHLLIATHSPIILSDIPKQNIIYLRCASDATTVVDSSTVHRESFGSNIFTLFNDAFFLPQGAIGEFAENKMKELLNDIKNGNNKNNITKIKQRIELIGDDFIKKQFIDLYEEKFNSLKSDSKDIKIKELEDENEKLRKELEQLRGTAND